MTLGDITREYRKTHNMNMQDFAKLCGLSKAYISILERNYNPKSGKAPVPSLETIRAISAVIGKDFNDVIAALDGEQIVSINPLPAPNLTPIANLDLKTVPLVGDIACGTPILAEENIVDYVKVPGQVRADFALTCRGNSMIGANIQDGDIVYIRQQPEVGNAQIAAVCIDNDEATLKRFYHQGNSISLVAENPAVPPLVFAGEDMARVRIVGLAVAFLHQWED